MDLSVQVDEGRSFSKRLKKNVLRYVYHFASSLCALYQRITGRGPGDREIFTTPPIKSKPHVSTVELTDPHGSVIARWLHFHAG